MTSNHFRHLYYSWMYRNTVDAYRRTSSTPQPYDRAAIEFLDRICKIESGLDSNPDWQEVMNQGAGLLASGCRNPLISIWYGTALFHRYRIAGAESVLKNVKDHLKDESLPAIQSFFVARTLLAITHYRQGGLAQMNCGYFELLARSIINSLRHKEFFGPEIRICYRLIRDFASDMSYGNIWELLQTSLGEAMGADPPMDIDPYFILLLQGETALEKAWQARGGELAYEVTEEQWRGFYANLAIARKALTRAWELHPEYPEAPSKMISVAMARQAGPEDTEILWFNRSVKAQMDYIPAYSAYLLSLLPRWGGSLQKIFEFGLICLQTNRFDTDVPMQYLAAIRMIGYDQKSERWRLPFRSPDIAARLDGLFEKMLAEPDRAKDRNRIMTQQALTQLWRGNYRRGAELLAAAGKRPDTKNGFAGLALTWSNRNWETVDTEISLFTGPDQETLLRAEKLHLAGHDSEAKELFGKILDKYRDDPGKSFYLRERMAFQMMDINPVASHYTALHIAASDNDLKTLKFLVDNGADLEIRNRYGDTPLISAVKTSQLKAVEFLLAAGADIHCLNYTRRGPLYTACLVKDSEMAEYLIDHQADINQTDSYGLAPIHVAVVYHLPKIVNRLLELNVPVDMKTNDGMTPLMYALRQNDIELTALLLRNGADVNIKTEDEDSGDPLIHFASSNNIEMCRLLLEYGGDVNAAGEEGWTPLHYAAYNGYAALVKLLLQKGANPACRLKSGETPLDIARLNHRTKVAKIIEEKFENGAFLR